MAPLAHVPGVVPFGTLLHPLAVSVIEIRVPGSGDQTVFGVVDIGCRTVAGHVSGRVVAEAGKPIIGGSGVESPLLAKDARNGAPRSTIPRTWATRHPVEMGCSHRRIMVDV